MKFIIEEAEGRKPMQILPILESQHHATKRNIEHEIEMWTLRIREAEAVYADETYVGKLMEKTNLKC